MLEAFSDSFWKPLFSDDSAVAKSNGKTSNKDTNIGDIGDDGIRNVKAACIGKLTTSVPARFLPQLQVSLCQNQRYALRPNAIRY